MRDGCVCGRSLEPHRRLLCDHCHGSISEAQRRYLEGFEAMLHTGEGIDFAMELLHRIGTPRKNRSACRPRF